MSYLYLLAGENLELAEAELKGFLKSQGISEEPEKNGSLAFTEEEPSQLKRLALVHEVSEKLEEVEEPSEVNYSPGKSFAVRTETVEGEHNTEKVAEKIGSEMEVEENEVELENPSETIKAYLFEDRIILGKLIEDIDRGLFKKRSNEERPFSSPVSLDPVLARVLVNLAELPPGGKVLDPFCGTGGILIEAGLCGILPCGSDTSKEMVEGTRENLEEYGILNHDIREARIEKTQETWDEKFDAVVTDLPYGKASKLEGNPVETFLEKAQELGTQTVFMYNQPEINGLEAEFEIYVHKNLTRYIYQI